MTRRPRATRSTPPTGSSGSPTAASVTPQRCIGCSPQRCSVMLLTSWTGSLFALPLYSGGRPRAATGMGAISAACCASYRLASQPACLTVSHLDSIVLVHCGFNHSADYRSVMVFGHAKLVEDLADKARALRMMVDRFFPGRTAQLRQSSQQAPIYMELRIRRCRSHYPDSLPSTARGSTPDDWKSHRCRAVTFSLVLHQLTSGGRRHQSSGRPTLAPTVARSDSSDRSRSLRGVRKAESAATGGHLPNAILPAQHERLGGRSHRAGSTSAVRCRLEPFDPGEFSTHA